MNLKFLTFLFLLTFLSVFISSSFAFADDFQDGMAAAQRGESKEAVRLFRLSAAQGNPTAQYNMGYMYEKGQGVPQNYKEAIKWFRIAAEQGLAQAKFKLGWMHANGWGVAQDYKEAVKWYGLSAKQGLPEAQYNLALMYANGQGVSQDYKAVFKWFRFAAEQGDSISQYSLGVMYGKGEGVSQDYVLAHVWFSLSASQGYQDAIEGRDIAEKEMTPQQIEKAQEMAMTRSWAKYPCAAGKGVDDYYPESEREMKRVAAYQFSLKIQQAIDSEDVESLFELVKGELTHGPRKKDVSEKSFDTIFNAEWKRSVLSEVSSCSPGFFGLFHLGGTIWYGEVEGGEWSISKIFGANIQDLSRLAEPSWVYGNDLLRSTCLTEVWASSDNYEFYHEHYGGDSAYPDFVRNIGRYMGAKIPLEAVTADWGDKVSLAVELNKCSIPYSSLGKPIKIDESDATITIEITDKAVRGTCSSEFTLACVSNWYTVLRNIPLEACGLLATHFKDDCIDIRLVQYAPAFRGGSSPASIYGIIKDQLSKRIYMVPLANFYTANDALNYVDGLLADLSTQDSNSDTQESNSTDNNHSMNEGEQTYPKIIQGKNGGYKVTLSLFKTKVLAEKFKAKLLKQGLSPNVEQKGDQWELFIGPYPSEESATQAKSSISIESDFSKKEISNKLIESRKPKESIEIHSSHFDRCAGEKTKFFEFADLIFYSMKAPLPCLLSPLSITKPKSKSRADRKFDQDVTENTLVGLDSSGKDILLLYNSSFDGVFGGDGPTLPATEGLIKLGESGSVVIFTAPSTDQGVIRVDQVSGEYFIVEVGMSTHVRAYLVSTTSLKAEYLSDGFIEIVDRDKLIFKAHGRKSYFKEVGGAFWYNAIIDRNGKIIDIDNEDLDSDYKTCFSKSDFLKKADIGLPESARDTICVNR
jgi:uncharacterized protein